MTRGGDERIDHPTSAATEEESEETKMVDQTASVSRTGVGKGSERVGRGSVKTRVVRQRRTGRGKVVVRSAKPFELTAWVQKLLDEAISAGPAPTPSTEEARRRESGVHVAGGAGERGRGRNVTMKQRAGVEEVAEVQMQVGEREAVEADEFSFVCPGVPALLVKPPVEDEEEEEAEEVEVEAEEAEEEEEEAEEEEHGEFEIDAAPPLAEAGWEEEGGRRGAGVGDEGSEAGLPKGVSAEEGLAHSLAFLANLNGGGLGFGLPPKSPRSPRSLSSEPQEVVVGDGRAQGGETEAGMETETREGGGGEKDDVKPPTVTVASQKVRQVAMIYEGAQEEVCV